MATIRTDFPNKSYEPGQEMSCALCDQGHYEELCERYEATAADDVKVVIPKLKLLRWLRAGRHKTQVSQE